MKTLAENALLVGQILTVLFLQNPAPMDVHLTTPVINVPHAILSHLHRPLLVQ